MNCQFPITDRFVDFVLSKLERSSLFDFQGLINLSFEKTSLLVDDVLVKLNNLFYQQIKEELKYFFVINLLNLINFFNLLFLKLKNVQNSGFNNSCSDFNWKYMLRSSLFNLSNKTL